ncbi:MAG TPA: hypothetical protein VG797_00810 [Phycisphaerales bacterium]|nr:hypothetical protein [Phycisphaerales bacterium]
MKPASAHRAKVRRLAPAKINLALAVGPPRTGDGLHPVCSWMHPIGLADELFVTRLEDDRLSRYAILWHDDAPKKSPIDWSITKDLAVRAHLLLEETVGRSLPVQLKLDKRIPVGGGLGGGSSDAAAMLLAIRDLFELDLPHERLVELALKLGSDVAFFLGEGPGIVEGVGERVERTPPISGHAVLIIPGFGCPTGPVYRAFDELTASRSHAMRERDVRALAMQGHIAAGGADLFNDLAPAAERIAPPLAELRARLREALNGTPVHVTGSGSTLFLLFDHTDRLTPFLSVIDRTIGEDAVAVVTHLGAPSLS